MSLISIIVPSHNTAALLRGTLASVSAQKAQWELLVIDSASTDASAEIVRALAPNAILIQKPNAGLASALNLGLSRARGDYLQFLEPGTELAPNKLLLQQKLLQQNKVDISFGPYQLFRESADGTRIFGEKVTPQLNHPITDLLQSNLLLPSAALLFSRDICQRAGSFRDDLPNLLQRRFLLDCADVGAKFCRADELASYCRSPEVASLSTAQQAEKIKEQCHHFAQIMDRWLGRGQLSEDKRQALRLAFVPCARFSAAHNPALFAEIAQRYVTLGGRFVPPGSARLRLFARAFGYPQAEKIARFGMR
jgi:glycosyltransferase involved in cell wall biosynthesis